MNSDQYTLNLTQGMDVFGSDGEKVGSVQDVQGEYVVVSKGFFFPTDYYIPFSALGNADGDSVYLNVTKDEALNQGWDQEPVTTGTTTAYDQEPITDAGLNVDNPVRTGSSGTYSDTGGNAPFDHEANTGHLEESDRIDVALTEEELTARKHAVERGEVRIDKSVVAEEQTLDVPVTEEQVHVSRRVVDRDVRSGDNSFEEGTIEVPVYGEEVDLDKRTRVREELEITKDQVQGSERVSGTVRHEEARVTDDAGSIVGDTQTKSSKNTKRQ